MKKKSQNVIGEYIKSQRKTAGLTQEEFAVRSGLGLRFIRELEQGKETVRLDKVNQALSMFGMHAVPGKDEKYWSVYSEKPTYMCKGIIPESYPKQMREAFVNCAAV